MSWVCSLYTKTLHNTETNGNYICKGGNVPISIVRLADETYEDQEVEGDVTISETATDNSSNPRSCDDDYDDKEEVTRSSPSNRGDCFRRNPRL